MSQGTRTRITHSKFYYTAPGTVIHKSWLSPNGGPSDCRMPTHTNASLLKFIPPGCAPYLFRAISFILNNSWQQTLYHAQWSDVAQCACTYIQSFPQHSAEHLAQIARTLARLGAGPAALRDLDATFQAVHDMGGCATCNIGGWRAFVERRIAGLEVFSAFLYA